IQSVFPDALRCLEIHLCKHSLSTRKRDDFESDTMAALADFFRIKTARRQRELLHNALDQRRLSASGTSSEQNLSIHLTSISSGNSRKTKLCVHQSLPISVRGRSADTCRLCRDAEAAMIWALAPCQPWRRSPFSECGAWHGRPL